MSKYFTKLEKIAPYLYEVWYETIDYEYAEWYFKRQEPVQYGMCSAVRNGNFYGRNFDWIYNEQAEFVVHYGDTLCVCGNLAGLTDEFVSSGEESDLYRILPFMVLDGINKAGLVVNNNVVPRDLGGNGWYEASDPDTEMNIRMVIRFLLDGFTSAATATSYLRDHISVYMPPALMDQNFEIHLMAADTASTYIVEFIEGNTTVINAAAAPYMTNFYVNFVNRGNTLTTPETATSSHKPSDDGLTEHAAGVERYNLIVDNYASAATEQGMRNLLNSLTYTNTYKSTTLPAWYSEISETVGDIDAPLADYQELMAFYYANFPKRSRDTKSPYYGTWQTTHSSIYNIATKTLAIVIQETNKTYNFSLGGNGMKDLLMVGATYNKTVKTFYIDSEAEVATLPTNCSAGSIAELLDGSNGLRVFMLRKTTDEPNNGTWVEI